MITKNINIRTFKSLDYPELVKLNNLVFPELPSGLQEFRHWDENRDEKHFLYRIVAEYKGEIIGMAEIGHDAYMFHPDKYYCALQVIPDYRNMGLGSRLYQRILKKLQERAALLLRAEVKEDRQEGLRFAKKHGFTKEIEEWEARANPKELDYKKYDGLFTKLRVKGIEIVNLEDVLEHSRNAKRELYLLDQTLAKDVPQPEPFTPMPFEIWEKKLFNAPNLLPRAFLVAKKGDELLGLHSFWASEVRPKDLYIGMTGVKREWRNRGIAKALKVQNMKWASDNGYEQIITWNNSKNVEILKINNELGFVEQPAWIGFKKELQWN